jgi:hypothetical protein
MEAQGVKDVAQKENDTQVEMAATAEKYEMPVAAVKALFGVFDKIRNGLSNTDAMKEMQELSDNDFETEEAGEVQS